jgi:hypothetical protein
MLEPEPTLLTAALLAPFLLEAFKYLVRWLVVKDAEFDFPKIFYTVTVPFFTLLAQITTGYLGWSPAPELSLSYVMQWFFGILITLAIYYMTIKPFKSYSRDNY